MGGFPEDGLVTPATEPTASASHDANPYALGNLRRPTREDWKRIRLSFTEMFCVQGESVHFIILFFKRTQGLQITAKECWSRIKRWSLESKKTQRVRTMARFRELTPSKVLLTSAFKLRLDNSQSRKYGEEQAGHPIRWFGPHLASAERAWSERIRTSEDERKSRDWEEEVRRLDALFVDQDLDASSETRNDGTAAEEIGSLPHDHPLLIFTDSGYASGFNPKQLTGLDSASGDFGDPSAAAGPVNDEKRTWYTGSSMGDRVTAQFYIQELAEDIYGKLRLRENRKLWESVCQELPSILKAFAIKIGHVSDTPLHRNAMRFIHKHSKDVTDHVALLCSHEDESVDMERKDSNEMSVSEKMALWSRSEADFATPIDDDLPYTGDGQDHDSEASAEEVQENEENAEIASYKNLVISNNPLYQWLLFSAGKSISLTYSSDPGPRQDIKKTILEKLPTGAISKYKPPDIYEIEFQLLWNVSALLVGQNLQSKEALDALVADTITLNGDTSNFQALSYRDYLNQTWLLTGEAIMALLKGAILDQGGSRLSESLFDGTELAAWVEDSRLRLWVRGPPFSVAECGEQFAWLSATWVCTALQHWSQQWSGFCMPTITHYSMGGRESEPGAGSAKQAGTCCIDIKFRPQRTAAPTSVSFPWQSLFRNPLAVAGFPIRHRPDTCPGVELSLRTMQTLAQANVVTHSGGRAHIKGWRHTLSLLKQVDDVFIWTIVSPNAVNPAEEEEIPNSGVAMLMAARHIITDIPADQNPDPEGQWSIFSCKPSRFSRIDLDATAQAALKDVCPPSSGKKSASSSHEDQNQLEEESSKQDATIINQCKAPLSDTPSDFLSQSYGSSVASADSASIVTSMSLDESIDSDMLSISQSSSQANLLRHSTAVSEFATKVLLALMQEWTMARGQGHGQSSGGNSNQTPAAASSWPSGSTPSSTNYAPVRKRDRLLRDEGDDDPDQQGGLDPSRKRGKLDEPPRKPFACPFWKMDSLAHQGCFARRLTRIRDVKQHLARQHTPDFYCERCFAVFKQKQTHAAHVMAAEPCRARPLARLEGVSNDQRKALSHKSKRWQNEAQQWYSIWDILFGEASKPESPYIEQSRDFDDFVGFCQQRVHAALEEQLTTDLLRSMIGMSNNERRQTLRNVVESGFRSAWESLSAHPAPSALSDESTSRLAITEPSHKIPSPLGISEQSNSFFVGKLQSPRTGQSSNQMPFNENESGPSNASRPVESEPESYINPEVQEGSEAVDVAAGSQSGEEWDALPLDFQGLVADGTPILGIWSDSLWEDAAYSGAGHDLALDPLDS